MIAMQRAREPFAVEVAAKKADLYLSKLSASMRVVGERAELIASSRADEINKTKALWRLADELGTVVAPRAACRQGCAHCCHISLGVFPAEAAIIGRTTRIQPMPRPADPGKGINVTLPINYESPCPWLTEEQSCSIYAVRPMACRVHFQMDEDDLLCQLHGVPIQAPFFDANALKAVQMIALRAAPSDMRAWFPHVRAGHQLPDHKERRASFAREAATAENVATIDFGDLLHNAGFQVRQQ